MENNKTTPCPCCLKPISFVWCPTDMGDICPNCFENKTLGFTIDASTDEFSFTGYYGGAKTFRLTNIKYKAKPKEYRRPAFIYENLPFNLAKMH